MVQSRLDPSINYPETRFLDKADIDFRAPLYSMILYKKSIIIALGQLKTNFQEKANIVYFPIYLIGNRKVLIQIGVFELLNNNLPDFLDKYGDLDLNLVGAPLIYQFIKSNLNLLTNYNEDLFDPKLSKIERDIFQEEGREEKQSKESEEKGREEKKKREDTKEGSEDSEEDSEEEKEDEGERKSESESESESRVSDSEEEKVESEVEDESREEQLEEEDDEYEKDKLKEAKPIEGKEEFKKEQQEFITTKDTKWIEKYFKNNNFDRVNNEGGGDCLFAVIRDGLETIGKNISVKEIRLKLANEATEDIFINYKEKYDMFKSGVEISNSELQSLIKRNKELKLQLTATTDRTEHKKIIEEATNIKEQFEELKQQLKFQKSLLEEWKFMKNLKNLSQFKELIQSSEFWADTWAISTLERILNIKLIIFSFEQYNSQLLINKKKSPTFNDLNIVLCGQLNDKILEEKGLFEPSYYIMTDYDGVHYQLITYKKRGAFTFKQLPFAVKKLVSESCLKGEMGTFIMIPDFNEFKLNKIDSDIKELEGGGVSFGNDPTNKLYDNNIQFQFYIKSLDSLPGKGSGEKISDKEINNFYKLGNIKDWRKKLSNFYEGEELVIDGKKWKTIEHYLNAVKFKDGFPSFYNQFSLDANTNLSKDPLMARAAGSKNGKFKGQQIRPTHILIDVNYKNKLPEAINKALYVKFIQNKELKNLLKATGNAKLLNYKKGTEPIVCYELMKIRKLIK